MDQYLLLKTWYSKDNDWVRIVILIHSLPETRILSSVKSFKHLEAISELSCGILHSVSFENLFSRLEPTSKYKR